MSDNEKIQKALVILGEFVAVQQILGNKDNADFVQTAIDTLEA